jgi:hypothetical protein
MNVTSLCLDTDTCRLLQCGMFPQILIFRVNANMVEEYGLKQDDLSPLLFNVALEYAIKKIQES